MSFEKPEQFSEQPRECLIKKLDVLYNFFSTEKLVLCFDLLDDLEKLISSSKYKKEKYNLDIKKVAKSLFTRYKTKPEELKEIVNELHYLLNQHLYKLQTNNI